jgi:hypothetical protein
LTHRDKLRSRLNPLVEESAYTRSDADIYTKFSSGLERDRLSLRREQLRKMVAS